MKHGNSYKAKGKEEAIAKNFYSFDSNGNQRYCHIYVQIRDTLGSIYIDEDFAELYK